MPCSAHRPMSRSRAFGPEEVVQEPVGEAAVPSSPNADRNPRAATIPWPSFPADGWTVRHEGLIPAP